MAAANLPAHQVPRLTAAQMAHFKAEGYLVLPGALDPELCSRARDHQWATLRKSIPTMDRDDPSTWPRDLKVARADKPEVDNPYLTTSAKGFHIYCATEPLFLDLFPLALWTVVEQLLGAGTTVRPRPADPVTGLCNGEFFANKNGPDHKQLVGLHEFAHLRDSDPPPMQTVQIAVPPTSPATNLTMGTRGLYCNMPAGDPDEPDYPAYGRRGQEGDYPGAHADTLTLTDTAGVHSDDRVRLRATIYFDDCPPDCGGFTLWPRSHTKIWHHTREAMRDGRSYHPYQDQVLKDMKAVTAPVETHGPAGTVVLWHQKTVHIAGHNQSTGPKAVIRQAMIHVSARRWLSVC
jgi:hypothetical protein